MTLPPVTTEAPSTYLDLSERGGIVYSGQCLGCHNNNGKGQNGPPLWGPDVVPGTYWGATRFTDAQGMLDYITREMPQYAPRSLPAADYIAVTAYILIQAGEVDPFAIFDQAKLKSIILK